MKLTFALILLPLFCFTQNIKILSAKDRSPVPFAFVTIKNKSIALQQISDINGNISFGDKIKDSEVFMITIKSIGFINYKKQLSGKDLFLLQTIYLKPDSLQLNEVVVTAQYEPTRAENAIQKIKIIDKEKIEQMGAVNLRDVLTNQLNIRLQQDNILGAGLSFQGLSGENVKILMDGVPMIGRLNGNIDLSQINMNNVERIEIIEGPLSVQYGTNALAGTINIITKKNILKTYQVGVTTYYESIGTYNANFNISMSKNKHLFQCNAGRNFFDGWINNDNHFIIPQSKIADSSRYKQWKPREQYFADANYNYQFKKIGVSLKSIYFQEKITNRGYPRAPYAESSFDDFYYTKRIDNSISLNGKISKHWAIQSTTAYNYYNRIKKTVFKDLTTLDEVVSVSNSNQDTTGFNLIMSRASFVHAKDSTKLNYEFGYDINYESAIGKRIEGTLKAMGDYALFTTAEYNPFKQLIIKPALRYTYNTVYRAPLIPSLNLRWKLNSKHTVRMSYAKGFRAPSIKELYFYFVDINHNIIGNRNLKAEASNNYMMSYNLTTSIKNVKYKLDVSGFYNDITNLITLAQVNSLDYSYINVGSYKTLGAQISNNIQYNNLTLLIGLSYIGRYNQISETYQVQKFNYSPEVQSNVNYNFKKVKTVLSVFYKYNGKLPNLVLIDNEVQQNFIDDYSIFDATLDKQFLKNKLRITIGCKNLLNVTNINANLSGGAHSSNSSSIAMATGRNYFLKLSLNLEHLK